MGSALAASRKRDNRRFARRVPVRVVDPQALTPRERQILDLLIEGLTNKQMAQRHGVSEHTIKVQLGKLYAKVGVKGRLELVLWALKQ